MLNVLSWMKNKHLQYNDTTIHSSLIFGIGISYLVCVKDVILKSLSGKTGEVAKFLVCHMQCFLWLMKFGNIYRVSGKVSSVLLNNGKFHWHR